MQQLQYLNQQIAQLYQQGRYQEAIAPAIHLCDLVRQHMGENNPNYATCLNNLAGLYNAIGNYTEAEPLLQQALEIQRRTIGENNAEYAKSLNNLAELYRAVARYTAAEPLYKQQDQNYELQAELDSLREEWRRITSTSNL